MFYLVTFLAECLSQPTMEDQETLGHLIYNFTFLPNFTIHQIAPCDLTCQVKIVLLPEKEIPFASLEPPKIPGKNISICPTIYQEL